MLTTSYAAYMLINDMHLCCYAICYTICYAVCYAVCYAISLVYTLMSSNE